MHHAHKQSLPESLQKEMKYYREWGWEIPWNYIIFHLELACTALDRLLIEHHLELIEKYTARDGYIDGMILLYVKAKESTGRIVTLMWHDGNQEFFARSPHGGWSPYTLDLAIRNKE